MTEDKKRFRLVRFAFEVQSGGLIYRYMITDSQIQILEINQWIESRSLRNVNTYEEYAINTGDVPKLSPYHWRGV